MHGLKDAYGNDQFYCDCGEAALDGTPYSGRFCEAEAVDVCGEGAEYGKIFCTKGTCREDFLDFLDQPCICDSGWEGTHCEYKTGEQPACDLDCNNGGTNIFVLHDERAGELRTTWLQTVEAHIRFQSLELLILDTVLTMRLVSSLDRTLPNWIEGLSSQ